MTHLMPKRLGCYLLTFVTVLMLVAGAATPVFAAGPDVSLKQNDTSTNVPFYVTNMFPGDSVSKEFSIQVPNHNEPLQVFFHADIRLGYEKLAEVLKCRIELVDGNALLYEGLMRDMPNSVTVEMQPGVNRIDFRITAFLTTDVGNPYQNQTLIADFRWWYLEPSVPITPVEPGGIIIPIYEPTHVKLTAEKILNGNYARGDDFTFVLTDAKGKVVEKVHNRDGMVEFSTMRFDYQGNYIYYMTEEIGDDPNMRYDKSRYKITIRIYGFESYSIEYERDGYTYLVLPRFVNRQIDQNGTPLPPETIYDFYNRVTLTPEETEYTGGGYVPPVTEAPYRPSAPSEDNTSGGNTSGGNTSGGTGYTPVAPIETTGEETTAEIIPTETEEGETLAPETEPTETPATNPATPPETEPVDFPTNSKVEPESNISTLAIGAGGLSLLLLAAAATAYAISRKKGA